MEELYLIEFTGLGSVLVARPHTEPAVDEGGVT